MKPSDHPEFFRLPPPDGRSRESTIVLDREGRFWHEGEPVLHPRMATAFASWISRHPDDGRYILNNGYDWSYFTVEETPFFVRHVALTGDSEAEMELSDGSREAFDPATLVVGPDGVFTVSVKGDYRARFTRAAQLALEPFLEPDALGGVTLRLGERSWTLPTLGVSND